MDKPWFECWFDTPYYHLLYGKRNEEEAAFFLDNLLAQLKLPAGARCWDLNCGKGRHSVYLNKKGFDVTGTDLSSESIEFAKQSENPTLRFYKHDMRSLFYANYFNAVFNLFTSFGYFRHRYEDEKVFQSIYNGLKPGGVFVMDFFNAARVMGCVQEPEEKVVGEITFKTRKKIENNTIIKEIKVLDKGKESNYKEEVKIYVKDDLVSLGEGAGLRLQNIFGDYKLSPFNTDGSERLILIFAK